MCISSGTNWSSADYWNYALLFLQLLQDVRRWLSSHSMEAQMSSGKWKWASRHHVISLYIMYRITCIGGVRDRAGWIARWGVGIFRPEAYPILSIHMTILQSLKQDQAHLLQLAVHLSLLLTSLLLCILTSTFSSFIQHGLPLSSPSSVAAENPDDFEYFSHLLYSRPKSKHWPTSIRNG